MTNARYHGSARVVAVPLAGMLFTQTSALMSLVTVPVLATEIAAETGISASYVGLFTSLIFGAAMFSSAASGGVIHRLGPVRTNQLGLVFSATALLFTLTANPWCLALSAVLIGAGYGPNTPSGSEVLGRVTPPRMRGLVFSIKQSGAPLGAMAGGLILPAMVVIGDWRVAVATGALIVYAAAVAIEPLRTRIDTGTRGGGPRRRASMLHAVRATLADPALRRLTVAAFVLMTVHTCFQTFTVAFLVEHVGLGLTAAGGLFAVLSVAGAISRVGLGWLSDRLSRARGLLVALSLGASASCALTATFTGEWSIAALVLACAFAGIGTAGWYGVFLAEIARLAPSERVGLATGGALFFVYAAICAGPLAFTAAVSITGSYPPAFWLGAAVSLVATVNLLRISATAGR